MNAHAQPAPIQRRVFTPGGWMLLAVAAAGAMFGLYRLFFGLGASTNLSQQYPWGIWIVADVSLIALAAGGFTTAAIVHVFHRERYHELARPSLVVAMLGYTFACVALAADLGRYYNIWHPILPSMWQGNSALFEVGMCVMCYVFVLYAEFVPVFCQRFLDDARYPRLSNLFARVNRSANFVMPILIVVGVGISCLHQSSLGHVMVLAPTKLSPLWWTPILSLLFLLSAIMVGFPTVIAATILGSWGLKVAPPMRTLEGLARYVPFMLVVYLGFKIGDMLIRQSYLHLADNSTETMMFGIETIAGLVVPLALLLSGRVRRSPGLLVTACMLVMLGVIANRANVYWIGYHPARATSRYFPSIPEWGITIGAVAGLLLCWRWIVITFPVITRERHRPAARDHHLRTTAGRAEQRVKQSIGAALILCFCATASSAAAPTTDTPPVPPNATHSHASKDIDCNLCHYCTTPTLDSPCVRRCPRPRTDESTDSRCPNMVIMRELEDAYLPVPFDHAGHAAMAQMTNGCLTCHHHSSNNDEHPSCKTCHAIVDSEADIDKPSLRGAYHQMCLNCHRERINERDCDICHRAKAGKPLEFRQPVAPTRDDPLSVTHQPIPEPDSDFYSRSLPTTETRVVFRHRAHTERFGLRCVECHHERSCTRCHAAEADAPPRTLPEHHSRCIHCHKDDMNLTGRQEGKCDKCHWQEGNPFPPSFTHDATGWPLKGYHATVECRHCHTTTPFAKLDRSCTSCHQAWDAATFDHSVTGLTLDDNHREVDCGDCHIDQRYDIPPTCTNCHEPEDGITFPQRAPGSRVVPATESSKT